MSGDKCYSTDGETYDANSLGDLLDQLDGAGILEVGIIFYEADPVHKPASYFFNYDRMMEDMGESAWDTAGEYATDFPDMTREQHTELEKIISDYLDKNCGVSFYSVRNVVEREVTQEMINDYFKGE